MKKQDYKKFETPERPKRAVSAGKKTTYLDETIKKSEKYDLLVNKIKGSIYYLKSQKAYYETIKGKLQIGYRNGYINGRIREIEDRIEWLERMLNEEGK